MGSFSQDFPFGIMDVVELLHLHIRRRQADSAYTDCPFCGDRRGKMNVNFIKNVWRCNYCGEHGGMLNLYARVNNTTNSEAYREICDALQAGDTSWGYGGTESTDAHAGFPAREPHAGSRPDAGIPQAERAGPQEIHQTYSLLLEMLSLNSAHRAHLRSEKRGLSDEQIDSLGFKSTPPYFLCRSLTERLMKQGCKVEGVPGFYLHEGGYWTAKFGSRTAGILIPAIGIDGLIRGMQILLDVPFKDKDDPPEKAGTKYIWLSSSTKNMVVTSGSPVHFIGNPCARTIYVTEGILKADIAHVLLNRSFVAVAGANNVAQLGPLFALLAQNGTELIIEAHDMDKYSNEMIAKGSSKIYLLARQQGMECRRLTWNPNYKGIDDWQLALRRKKQQKEGGDQNLQKGRAFFCQEGKESFWISPTADTGSAFTSFVLTQGRRPSRLRLRESGICTRQGMSSPRLRNTGWCAIRSLPARKNGKIRKYWNRFRHITETGCRKATEDAPLHLRMWWNWTMEQAAAIST